MTRGQALNYLIIVLALVGFVRVARRRDSADERRHVWVLCAMLAIAVSRFVPGSPAETTLLVSSLVLLMIYFYKRATA